MGKKYDFLKEELARNPVRDLLVINDQLVRQKYFEEANDVLKAIDQMEGRIRDFHSKDQKLFDEWYKLTFRTDQKAIDHMQTEFRALARFHNWIVAASRMLDIGMAEAYGLMKEEQERYLRGDEDERSQIDRDRAARDAFIEEDSQEKYNEEPQYDSDDEEAEQPSGAHLSQVLGRLEDLILKEDREPGLSLQARIDRIMDLTDDEFKYWLKEDEVAFLLFDISLSWGESQHDHSFFLRMWKLMSRSQKKTFSEVYYALTGQSLDAFVRRVDREKASQESFEDEEDFEFTEDFIGNERSGDFEHKISPPQEEKLKGLYRKLIRKLHPDLQASAPKEDQTSWIKRVWEMVQKAYNSKDVSALEKLFSLTLLRLNALNQLTLDEIQQAKRWLEKDLSNLQEEARHLKKSMAWGFSLKKDYSGLTRKIRKDFEQTLNSIRYQMEEIEREHRVLEMLFASEKPQGSRNRKKKKLQNRRNGKRSHSRRRFEEEDDNQESFSF